MIKKSEAVSEHNSKQIVKSDTKKITNNHELSPDVLRWHCPKTMFIIFKRI
ncbi:MAG: hypothetical protein ABSG15_10005 [FCB group bacterium]